MSEPLDDFFDEPELIEEAAAPPPRKKRRPGGFLNLLSGIFVTGTLVVGLLFAIIFINPQSSLNPLPPTTLPALFLTWTPSPTPKPVLPSTWTPTPSPTVTETPTQIPIDTPLPTLENTPIPTADLESGTTFGKQNGSPTYEINTSHLDAGCNWLGAAGQIFDNDGAPVSGILVEAGGTLSGVEISGITLSGMAPDYGEGGYELILGDSPAASNGEIWIQLLDQANLPLSDKTYFQTFDSCDSNLIKINFVQTSAD
jgi:hypothetical protein